MNNVKDVPGFVYQLGGLIVASGNEFTKALKLLEISSFGCFMSAKRLHVAMMQRSEWSKDKRRRRKQNKTENGVEDSEQRMREVAEKYGCEDPAKVLRCLKRILGAG